MKVAEGVADPVDATSQLLRALDLSDGFQLYVIVCDVPRLATDLLAKVEPHLRERRGPGAHLTHHMVSFSGRVRGDVARVSFAEGVVRSLLEPEPEDAGPLALHVLDASRAAPTEAPDWRHLFGALNSSRDRIARTLRGELLLLLPPWLEPELQQVAPDFASIVSAGVLRLQEASSAEVPDRPMPATFAAKDATALRNVALAQCREARSLHAAGDFHDALRAAGEGIRAAASWTAGHPQDRGAASALSDLRWWEGRAWEALGDVPEALGSVRASVRALQKHAWVSADKRRVFAERSARLALLLERNNELREALAEAERASKQAEGADAPTRFEVGLIHLGLLARADDLPRANRQRRLLEPLAAELGGAAPERLDEAARTLGPTTPLPSAPPAPPDRREPPEPGGPYAASWYVPRERVEREARHKLEHPAMPLVLTGPAGAGRRWLARHLLSGVAAPARVVWVDLTPVGGPGGDLLDAFADAVVGALPVDAGRASGAIERAAHAVERALAAANAPLYLVLEVPPRFAQEAAWVDVEFALRAWIDSSQEGAWSRLRLVAIYPQALHEAMRRHPTTNNSSLRAVTLVEHATAGEVAAMERLYRAQVPDELLGGRLLIAEVARALWRARRAVAG